MEASRILSLPGTSGQATSLRVHPAPHRLLCTRPSSSIGSCPPLVAAPSQAARVKMSRGSRCVATYAASSSSSASADPSPTAFTDAPRPGPASSPPKGSSGLYPETVRQTIEEAWVSLVRWSRMRVRSEASCSVLESTKKIVVFGGGSFGTALASTLARRKADLDVVLLIRDEKVCDDINKTNTNTKYLKEYLLPPNVRATTNPVEAISGAQFALHAVPCQHSRSFLEKIKGHLPPSLPFICVSKGLELGTGETMAQILPSVLGKDQPACFLSGPSFAKEVMEQRPTGLVCASKALFDLVGTSEAVIGTQDPQLAERVQELMAGEFLRINTSEDVVGVEICGALKNVLAIAAGIVDGMDLGRNAQAAVVVQGCAEIRWLAERMGAHPRTVSGLSGLGDIMLTCYGDLSRNRSVGLRLGAGESIDDIIASSSQVAEGVATAGVVVMLARKYRVQLPVLTAVAQVLGNELGPKEAVEEIMQLPQVAER